MYGQIEAYKPFKDDVSAVTRQRIRKELRDLCFASLDRSLPRSVRRAMAADKAAILYRQKFGGEPSIEQS